ncbi:MAG: protein arginine kinase [Planctomycetota bacterium]|nr:protein arginine kinase [Planctomycetota bacterium]
MTGGPYYEPPKPSSPESCPEWLKGEGDAADVVLSSRVRVARNLATGPFALRSTKRDRQRVLEVCRDRILTCGIGARIAWEELHESTSLQRALLVERHIISKQLSRGKVGAGGAAEDPRAVAYTLPDERVAIMVNEEDHLRVQGMRSGLALSEAWAEVDRIDDLLEAGLDFAFSTRFGYLTACPTNVGTGVRMSCMLHLPGLRLTGDIEKVKRAAGDMNLAVRGFYGEGSEAIGDLFQISNQTTLGKTERAILTMLESEILPKVIEYERLARRELQQKRRLALEDQAWRAWGLVTSARLLTTEEAMQALSMVRLGALLGVLPGSAGTPARATGDAGGAGATAQGAGGGAAGQSAGVRAVNLLMLLVQPAHLQKVFGRELDQEQRRAARAALLRQRLGRV